MSDNNGTAAAAIVSVREYDGLNMAVAPAEAKRRVQELQAFVASVMVRDQDYGVIPGTGEKPTLLQPGAQKLAEIYGLVPHFHAVDVVKDWDRGFFYFEYACTLTSRRDGSPVGEGMGSCNSRESKYAGRWVALSELPTGLAKDSLQKREGARWCFKSELPAGFDIRAAKTQERVSKKNGSKYTVYQVVDTQYLIPNPDPYSLVNTLQKMAAKRAYIHAVIGATRSAGIFTQDVEDLPAEAFGEVAETRTWDREDHAPAQDTKLTEHEKAAALLREKLEAATTEAELKTAMTEIGKAGLAKPYLDALRDVAKKARDAMRAAAENAKAPAGAAASEDNDANEEWAGDGAGAAQ